ncbi:hypothetical protein YPPY64_0134, partial [Yersinia pestis PY-64]
FLFIILPLSKNIKKVGNKLYKIICTVMTIKNNHSLLENFRHTEYVF